MLEAREGESYELVAALKSQDLRSALMGVIHAAEKDEKGRAGVVCFEVSHGTLSVIAHNRRRMAAAWVPCRSAKTERIGVSGKDAQAIVDTLAGIDGDVTIEASQSAVRISNEKVSYVAKRRRARTPLWMLTEGKWLSRQIAVSHLSYILNAKHILSVLGVAQECFKPVSIFALAISKEDDFTGISRTIKWYYYNANEIAETLEKLAEGEYVDICARADIDNPPLYLDTGDGMAAFRPVLQ